jgi:hypothetical protein
MRGEQGDRAAGGVAEERGAAADPVDQRGHVLELALDRADGRAHGLATPAPVVVHCGEPALGQQLRQPAGGRGERPELHRTTDEDDRRAVTDDVAGDPGAVVGRDVLGHAHTVPTGLP